MYKIISLLKSYLNHTFQILNSYLNHTFQITLSLLKPLFLATMFLQLSDITFYKLSALSSSEINISAAS